MFVPVAARKCRVFCHLRAYVVSHGVSWRYQYQPLKYRERMKHREDRMSRCEELITKWPSLPIGQAFESREQDIWVG